MKYNYMAKKLENQRKQRLDVPGIKNGAARLMKSNQYRAQPGAEPPKGSMAQFENYQPLKRSNTLAPLEPLPIPTVRKYD